MADDFAAWSNQGTTGVVQSAEIEFTDEPRFETYRTQTGFSEDVISLAARYKTSVVANRMTYIGNIKAKNKLGWSPKTAFTDLVTLMVEADV